MGAPYRAQADALEIKAAAKGTKEADDYHGGQERPKKLVTPIFHSKKCRVVVTQKYSQKISHYSHAVRDAFSTLAFSFDKYIRTSASCLS